MQRLTNSQVIKPQVASPSDEFSLLSLAPTSPSSESAESYPSTDKEWKPDQTIDDIQTDDETLVDDEPHNFSHESASLSLSSATIRAQLQESLGKYTNVLSHDATPPAPTSVVNRGREERAQGVLLSPKFNISRFFSGAESSVRLIEDDMSLRKGGLSTDFVRYAIVDALKDEPATHVISYCCSMTLGASQDSSILKDMMRSLILQLLEISDLDGFQSLDGFAADDIDSLYSLFQEVVSRSSNVRCFCIIDRWTALEGNVAEDEIARALEMLLKQTESSNNGSGRSFNLLFTDVRKCQSIRSKLSSGPSIFSVYDDTGRGFRRLARPSFQTKLRGLLVQAS